MLCWNLEQKQNRPAERDGIAESLAHRMYLTDSEQQAAGVSMELRAISHVWAVGESRLIGY